MFTQVPGPRRRFLLCAIPLAVSMVLLLPVGQAILHDVQAQQKATAQSSSGGQVGFVTMDPPSGLYDSTQTDTKPARADDTNKPSSPARVGYVSMEPMDADPEKPLPSAPAANSPQPIFTPKMAPVK